MEVIPVERKLAKPDPVRPLNVLHRAVRGAGWAPTRRTTKFVLGAAAVMPSREITQNVVMVNSLGIVP